MVLLRKRILLIDCEDSRRDSRVLLLRKMGYEVEVRRDSKTAALRDEDEYDLVIIGIPRRPESALAYGRRLSEEKMGLPILYLADRGAFVLPASPGRLLEAGEPRALMEAVSEMLVGTGHIKELPTEC